MCTQHFWWIQSEAVFSATGDSEQDGTVHCHNPVYDRCSEDQVWSYEEEHRWATGAKNMYPNEDRAMMHTIGYAPMEKPILGVGLGQRKSVQKLLVGIGWWLCWEECRRCSVDWRRTGLKRLSIQQLGGQSTLQFRIWSQEVTTLFLQWGIEERVDPLFPVLQFPSISVRMVYNRHFQTTRGAWGVHVCK